MQGGARETKRDAIKGARETREQGRSKEHWSYGGVMEQEKSKGVRRSEERRSERTRSKGATLYQNRVGGAQNDFKDPEAHWCT